METPLSEYHWRVLLCRATGASSAQKRWTCCFLKTTGVFYFAKRQEPQAPRKMEKPPSEDQWHVLLCRTTRGPSVQTDGNATFGRQLACSVVQKGRSPKRPDRWKPYFLQTNGVFYFAERRELQAPRKMKTLLSEDHWRVPPCRATGASSAQKRWTCYLLKTNGTLYVICGTVGASSAQKRWKSYVASEDHWRVLLCKATGAPSAQKDGHAIC